MATVSQTFRALIEADAKGAVKNLEKFNGEVDKATVGAAKKTDQLSAAFSRVGRVIGSAAIVEGFRRSIDAASDLEESVNAVNVTFGKAANGILELSEDSARGVGLASAEFNGLAVQFSSFAERVAGDGGSVVQTIDDITKRAADFASVMNLDVNEAARIFQSALAGETEPIKKFGIDMSAATVEAYAFANGIAEAGSKLTENDKVVARYGLLMEATEKTAGDFANTSDSLANQQRILRAELTNAAASLGQELLPAAATAAGTLSDIVGVLGEMPAAARQFTVGAGAVALGLATIGARATSTLALLGLVAGEVQAISAGVRGDMDFLNRDVSIFEKPFQLAGQFGFALGSGGGWGAWRDEAMDALDAAEIAAATFDGTLLDGIDTTDAARAAIDEWAAGLGLSDQAAQHAANTVAIQYLPAIRDAEGATSDAAQEAQIASEMQRDQAKASEHTATVMKGLADRQREAAEATERHRAAVEALFDEVNENLSSMFDYEESIIDVENATKDYADAAAEALEVANDSEASAADREQAMRDMRQAEIDAANAALDASAAYAESQGAIEGTTEFAMLQRQELERLAGEFPELNGRLREFIAELDRIPAVKTVSLIIERNGVNRELASAGTSARVDEFGNLRQFDTGGVVPGPKGVAQLAVVHGGETILPTHKASLPSVGAMGGVTIGQVVVTAPAGADADAFGRAVREAIRRETRWSGPVTGWSAA